MTEFNFHTLIRDKRAELGLSVLDVSKRTRESGLRPVSKQMISFLERGDRLPGYETGLSVAEALGIDANTALTVLFRTRVSYELASERQEIARILKAAAGNKLVIDEIADLKFLNEIHRSNRQTSTGDMTV